MDENEIHEVDEHLTPENGPFAEETREPIPWGVIVLLIWAALIVVFAVQNADDTTVEFLAWDWQMPVALLILITALVTLVVSGVWFAFYRRRRRRRRELKEDR